jgi:hypothetical protein
MNEAFKDISPFQGIYQYFDNSGIQWRLEKQGRCCKFFEEDENAFIHIGNFILNSNKKSLKLIHESFINDLLQRDCSY